MIPHIENGEACIVVAISTEGRKAAAEIMGTVSLGNKSIKGVAKVREANKEKPPQQEKPPLQMFMEQTPKLSNSPDFIRKIESVNDRKVEVSIRQGDIAIYVDDSYEKVKMSKKEGTEVAIRAMRMVQSEVAKMTDGTLLTNTPTVTDGLGKKRIKLYERAGFGPPDQRRMRSVVKNGKMTPISGEQYRYLMENRHHTRFDNWTS